jgi:neutral ceramidase
MLQAGAFQVDITPSRGSLVGVDFFTHYARFIHDPLFAKALVLQQGATQLALVVIDICIIPTDLLAEIRAFIHHQTGIPLPNIMVSCTHTHGAGDVAGLLGGAVDIAYRIKLPPLVAEAVVGAMARVQPAEVGNGAVTVEGYQRCRRYVMKPECEPLNPVTKGIDALKTNPFGLEHLIDHRAALTDPGLGFLAVRGLDGAWIAVLANYSMHYVGDWDVDTITADYYGAFARLLQQKLGADDIFVGMMTYGTGADVNTWDFMAPQPMPEPYFAKMERVAKSLTQPVFEAIQTLDWQRDADLAVQYEEIQIGIRKPTEPELAEAAQLLERHPFANLAVDPHGMAMIYAREQLLLADYPDTHTAAVQAIQIGDLRIGALGGELFSETGLWLKNEIPGNYFTICLANTYDGYVPPAHELDKGGYETWRARSSFLEAGAEEHLRKTLLQLVQTL